MNHTSASININNSIEKHDLSILSVMLAFTYMSNSSSRKRSSSSSSSKAILVITLVVIRIIVLLLDRSTNE